MKHPLPRTARGIDAIQTPAARIDYHDTEVAGLLLRVTPHGARTWAVRYKLGARSRRLTLGALSSALGVAKARTLAAEALLLARQGKDPAALRSEARAAREALKDALTVVDVVGLFLKDKRPKPAPSTLAEYQRMLKAYLVSGPPFVIPSPTASDKEYFAFRAGYKERLDEIAEKHGPIQANRVFQLVRAAMSWAKVERLTRDNPLDGVKRPQKETPRLRVLSDNEIRWLFEALEEGPPIEGSWVGEEERARRALTWKSKAAAVRTWLRCGTRERETLRCSWSSIDLDGKLWTIPGELRKGTRPHLVPLAPQVIADLKQLQAVTGSAARVFAGASWKKGNIHRWWKVIVAAAEEKGAAHFTIHDLRKTCSTLLGDLGTPDDIVSLILGHTKKSVTGRHYNFSDRLQERRVALEKLADRLDAIVAGGRGKVLRGAF